MLFQTPKFLIFFFVFYVIFLALGRRGRSRVLWILFASYVFYAHWDWRFLALIVFSTALDFQLGKWIEDTQRKKLMIVFSVVLNLTILGIFKYLNFFILEFSQLTNWLGLDVGLSTLEIVLPVGISFYTFESMSYVIDIYRGKIKATRSFFDYAAFISFFPHLVAGPIIRPKIFFSQIREDLKITESDFYSGLMRFSVGVFKKIYLADILALYCVDGVFESPRAFSGLDCLVAAYAYAFQIYLDFSAYSDMAIGLSKVCGIDLPENFNYPYAAGNLREFWDRWHISLSTWLRDYLYIPLGGNRDGVWKKYRNIFITMFLGGLWHGANMTFVIWGLIHGVMISLSHLLRDNQVLRRLTQKIPWFLGWFVTFHIVVVAWIFFRAPSLEQAGVYFSQLGRLLVDFRLTLPGFVILILALCGWIHFAGAQRIKEKTIIFLAGARPAYRICILSLVVMSILVWGQQFQPFIYFQF